MGLQQATYAEFIGTFFFAWVVAHATHDGASSVVVGLTLAGLIYWGGPISGGHFNPALSFSMYFKQFVGGDAGFAISNFLYYAIAQFIGAVIGAFLFRHLHADWDTHASTEHADKDIVHLILTEFVFTAFFCMAVHSATRGSNSYFGLAIGAIVIASGAVESTDYLGGLNPAVTVALYFTHHISLNTLIYAVIGQLLGGAFAAFSHHSLLTEAAAEEEHHDDGDHAEEA